MDIITKKNILKKATGFIVYQTKLLKEIYKKKIYKGVVKITKGIIGVEHDENINGHALDGKHKNKHGWYYNDITDGYIIKQSDFSPIIKYFVFTNGECEEKEVENQDGI